MSFDGLGQQGTGLARGGVKIPCRSERGFEVGQVAAQETKTVTT